MYNSGVVQILQSLGYLENYVLLLRVRKHSIFYGSEQIRVHVLKQQVQVHIIIRPDDLVQFYDFGVVQLAQQIDFPVGSLGVHLILKSREDLLQGVDSARVPVPDFPDVTVGPAAQFLQFLESLQDVVGYTGVTMLGFHIGI